MDQSKTEAFAVFTQTFIALVNFDVNFQTSAFQSFFLSRMSYLIMQSCESFHLFHWFSTTKC